MALLEKHGKALDRGRLPRSVDELGEIDLGLEQKVALHPGQATGGSEVYFSVVEKGQFVPLTDWKRWRP